MPETPTLRALLAELVGKTESLIDQWCDAKPILFTEQTAVEQCLTRCKEALATVPTDSPKATELEATPGPWRAVVTTCEDDIEIYGPNGEHVAVVVHYYHNDIGPKAHEANGHIIAASQEMHEALEQSIKLLQHMREFYDLSILPNTEDMIEMVIGDGKLALAKARGEGLSYEL